MLNKWTTLINSGRPENDIQRDTTKKCGIRHVSTVAVTVATWPNSHVS